MKQIETPIPYGKQQIDDDDVNAVVKVLRSSHLTQGPVVNQFEKALANYCGARHAIAFSSGTAALHAACAIAGLGPKQELLTSPISFVASSNCGLFLGAKARFADVDFRTAQITAKTIKEHLRKKTKVIVPVDFAGRPSDAAIYELAKKKNITVIQDACHSLGSEWKDEKGKWHKTGDCSYADMTCFSFHPVKSITTGEGGAITTNDTALANQLIQFRQHGITKNKKEFLNKEFANEPWYHEMHNLGYNYRITDIQAALGLNQINKLDHFIKKRAELVATYLEHLPEFVVTLEGNDKAHRSAHHLFPIRVQKNVRNQLMRDLIERGIHVQLHYIPIYRQPYYQSIDAYDFGDYPNAEEYFATALSLPVYVSLSQKQVRFIAQTITKLMNSYAANRMG
ncbi:MAG: UDP-4-amino-4,6-dideoxy-N-acetyl-beta-L-altrosamine transaminase [Deltaproteobacteria bacterium]|nr:UDP-4-amino-4,6-dideoxy-N-acetyl-beta-L-altrosamine transaminase [Deltaproteobacteria bacterium]